MTSGAKDKVNKSLYGNILDTIEVPQIRLDYSYMFQDLLATFEVRNWKEKLTICLIYKTNGTISVINSLCFKQKQIHHQPEAELTHRIEGKN